MISDDGNPGRTREYIRTASSTFLLTVTRKSQTTHSKDTTQQQLERHRNFPIMSSVCQTRLATDSLFWSFSNSAYNSPQDILHVSDYMLGINIQTLQSLAAAHNSMSSHIHNPPARKYLEYSIGLLSESFADAFVNGSFKFPANTILPVLNIGSCLPTKWEDNSSKTLCGESLDRVAAAIINGCMITRLKWDDQLEHDFEDWKKWKKLLPDSFARSAKKLRILLEKADQELASMEEVEIEEISSTVRRWHVIWRPCTDHCLANEPENLSWAKLHCALL